MSAPYAECDIDALISIRDQIPLPPGVADVVTASGVIRGRVPIEYVTPCIEGLWSRDPASPSYRP